MAEITDLLARSIYQMAQVDRILALSGGTAKRWIDGYSRVGRRFPPVVRPETTGDDAVTWGEFAETRLLAEYRESGIPMVRMRPAVEKLRERFNRLYPLAYAHPWLDSDGRELVMRVQEEVRLERRLQFVVVRNGQISLNLPVDRFVSSADFGEGGEVRRINPYPDLNRVWLDPLRQFGEPTVRSVPTAVLAEQFRAGDPIAQLAEIYELSDDWVEQAIRYELRRGRDSSEAA